MASNLRRSKRTVGKRITELNKRVARLQKRSAPTEIANRTVTEPKLAQGAVSPVTLSPAVSSAIVTAQATADGKNKIFYSNDPPSAVSTGDLWFDTNNDFALARWDGDSWEPFGLGNAAIANLDAGKLTAGTISVTGVGGVNAINAGIPVSGNYPFSVNSSGVVRAVSGTVGGFTLSGSTITASYLIDNFPLQTESGYITLETDGTLESNYTIAGITGNYYTTVKINDYGPSGQGAITVEGTPSGSYAKRLYTTTGDFSISDARLKTIVDEDVDALSIVKAIDTVKFTYTADETSKAHFGFIAQQIYNYVPDAVIRGGDDAETNPWLLSNDPLIPYLTKAVKQLSLQVESLQARLDALEGR